jgi:Ulp1 family protease
LNDVIVNFGIRQLYSNIDMEIGEKVHIFDTHFYDELSKNNVEHKNVARWTKSMDLFKKQLIVIPVCKASHWFTILVINPGLITVNICSSIFGAVKMHYKNYFFPSLQRSPVTGKGGMH